MSLPVLRGVVAEKTDAELFTIETTGTDVTEESRLYKRVWKPLKCEANLVNQSKIEPVVGRKSKSLKNRMKGKARLVLKKNDSSMKQHVDSAEAGAAKDSTQQEPQRFYHLWSTGEPSTACCVIYLHT